MNTIIVVIANIGFLLWFIAGYKIGVNAGKKKILNKLEKL